MLDRIPSNPAAALGQDVGKIYEIGVREAVRVVAEDLGHSVRPEKMENGTGNTYQIDAVVFNSNDEPVIIIDPKYIRYTKHNRDKGSWLCVAHYNLRKTFPTIRKSIAVLGGNWTRTSIALIRSFGVEVQEVSFAHMVDVLDGHGVEFDWPENDRGVTALRGLETLRSLSDQEKVQIGEELVLEVIDDVQWAVAQVLEAETQTLGSRVTQVEVLLKTNRDEMMLQTYDSITDCLRGMTGLVADLGDISGLLQRENC